MNQYVLDLRGRIESTCGLSQRQLSKVQVLVLIPDAKRNLNFVWGDPAEIIGRCKVVNCCIKFDGW
jgi:hypothetical protein